MSNSFKKYDKKIYAGITKDAESFAIQKIINNITIKKESIIRLIPFYLK